MSGPSDTSDYVLARRGTPSAPWSIVHRETGLKIPVLRPYPGHSEVPLPPIEVANFRTRAEAHAAAKEIDWSVIAEACRRPEVIKAAEKYKRKRAFDAAYQRALVEARAARGPWPWEPEGLLHQDDQAQEAAT
jgi:hypothetical protein